MNRRIIVPLSILIVGAAFSAYMAIPQADREAINGAIRLIEAGKNTDNSLKFQAALPGAVLGAQGSNQPTDRQLNPNNFTDTLVKSFLQEIAKENPDGIKKVDGEIAANKPAPENLSGFLDSRLSQKLSYRTYENRDVRSSGDNSEKAQTAYLEAVHMVLYKYTGIFKTSALAGTMQFLERNNPEPLTNIVVNIPNLMNELLSLEVPSDFLPIQIALLNLWEKKLTYYQAVLDSKDDPLKGYIALNEILNIGVEEINLQTVMSNKYKDLKS